jgi:hypothetical protein
MVPLTGLLPGLNILDFHVDDLIGAEGLRVEVQAAAALVKSNAQFRVTVGGVSQTITADPNWRMSDIIFTPTAGLNTLEFESITGETWIDSVVVESSGSVFLHPEEPFELIESERAMGEWRLEVQDTRTGAILPTSEVLEWSLEIAFADTRNPALQMKPGDIVGPLTLENDNVLWVVLDPCQGATFARLVLEGIGNVDELMLFADLNGFPTGNPELDDFLPIANTEVTGANGRATFEISTLLPAPARLTGKPVFIGIINQFIDATNQFTLDFQSDGDCTISGPPPILSPDTPSVGDVEPDPNGGSSTNSTDGVFQFVAPANARAATVTVVSDGDVSVYVQKDTIPTTVSFGYTVNTIPGAGTETLRIDQASTPPLTEGLYYVRVGNNTAQRVNFQITVTFEFDTTPTELTVLVIRNSVGGIQIQFTPAEVGVTYDIEATDSLTPANWQVIETRTATSPFETYDVPVDLTRQYRFFRIRRQ